MSYPQTVVGRFYIGHGRHLVATVSDLRGERRIDLREWFEREDPNANLYPLRRGINLPALATALVFVAHEKVSDKGVWVTSEREGDVVEVRLNAVCGRG